MMRGLVAVLLYIVTFLFFIAGCREPFNPSIISESTNYLVVEGFINTGQGPTNIYLSRTTKVTEPGAKVPELKASIQVEDINGLVYPLQEVGDGKYTLEEIKSEPSVEYRLHITTADGKEYFSDFVKSKETPAIDSVSWRRDDEGIQVYVNTHDPTHATRYYLWEYEETWEYNSPYNTEYDYVEVDGEVINRDKSINYERCWSSDQSKRLIINSTAQLSEDVVQLFPIRFIPSGSIKLSTLYSIKVKQIALSREAYEYLRIMKSNTETMGSVFDPQPSGLRGNIYSESKPDEPVIGYMYAANDKEQRLFIERSEVLDWSYVFDCPEPKLVEMNPDSLNWNFLEVPPDTIPKDPDLTTENPRDSVDRQPPGLHEPLFKVFEPDGWMSQIPECVDCRFRGGVNVKPDFWPN